MPPHVNYKPYDRRDPNSIYLKVKNLMRRTGKTNLEMSEELGLSLSGFSRRINNDRQMPIGLLEEIAAICGAELRIEILLPEDGGNPRERTKIRNDL